MKALANLKWKLYKKYSKWLMLWGLRNGYIRPYSEKLIKRLRGIYYGGMPASVLLLCRALTDGHCYDRALLLSRAFLTEDGDVQLVYGEMASLGLNPSCKATDGDHCVVEHITKDGKHYIYDTSIGFMYDKWLYWLTYFPKVRLIRTKSEIARFVEAEEHEDYLEAPPRMDRRFVLDLVIPVVEACYGKAGEVYSFPKVALLQREVELFRSQVASA